MVTSARSITRFRPLLAVIALWLAMISCTVFSQPENPEEGIAIVQTSSAATLQAMPTGMAEPTASPVLQASPTPEQQATSAETAAAGTAPAETATAPAAETPAGGPQLLPEYPLTVAYVSPTRDLWVWQPDSEARQLTSSGDVDSVQVSDDTTWIAFTRSVDYVRYSLWVVRSDGSEERVVMDLPGFDAIPRPPEAISVMPATFDWVPGTHILAFNTRPAFEGPGLMLNNDLWLADIDEGAPRQVFSAGSGGQFHFSPDGSQVAIVQPDSISLVNSDGSNRRDRVLVYPQVITYSEYAFYADPQWAQDSSYLVVVIPPPAALDRPEDPATIWRIPVDGSPAVSVASFRTAPFFYPVLSPSLEQLAYMTQVGESADNRRALHLARVDGSEDRVFLEEAFLIFQSWSPDSSRFLYSFGETNQVMVGEAGGGSRAAGEWNGGSQLRWVDENRFLLIARPAGDVELRMKSVDGEEFLIASFPEGGSSSLFYDFSGQ